MFLTQKNSFLQLLFLFLNMSLNPIQISLLASAELVLGPLFLS